MNVLLIEDNPGDADLIADMLDERPLFKLICVDRVSRALDCLKEQSISLILLDLSLPDSMGMHSFAKIYADSPHIPIVVLTGTEDENIGLSAVKAGAQDYLIKGRVDSQLLSRTMTYAIERKKNEERLIYMANHDALTGLPNRALFEDRLRHAIAQSARDHRMVGVIFMDLDQFKMVNDSLGHDQGDILLCVVASRLRDAVRASDTVARLGGDEFVIILSELETGEDAVTIASKVMKSLEQSVILENQELNVAASIGIAIFPKDGETIWQLVKNADAAMYRSKELGRKQICFYSPEMNARLLELLRLENDLRRAIEKDELEVYYQPKLAMNTRRILGFEALLRWRHPVRGMVSPDEIIPLAESTGLILAIGNWVLQTACRQLMEWQKLGFEAITIAVNLSARQFWKDDLVENIGNVLLETGLQPGHLELEITESSAMRNADETIATLNRLNSMGIMLSIDDFGTGYSSLSYLKRFPIHALKVDQSFVRDITVDPDAAAIAQGIIALAHSMNLQVIAEGVQTESQFDMLQQWHCDAMQGYLFSKPVESKAALHMLQQGHC